MTHEKNFGSADATVVAPQTLSGLSGPDSVAERDEFNKFIEREVAAVRLTHPPRHVLHLMEQAWLERAAIARREQVTQRNELAAALQKCLAAFEKVLPQGQPLDSEIGRACSDSEAALAKAGAA